MFNPNSPISQILPTITDIFCSRLIVVDGLVLPVLTTAHFRSSDNRVWISSTTEIISSNWISFRAGIKSIAFEIGSKFKEIQTQAFSGTDLEFVTFPSSVEVLGLSCFYECRSLSSVIFESESRLSRLSRIEREAFIRTGLIKIIPPSSVDILGEK
jgi:hypothetical protein